VEVGEDVFKPPSSRDEGWEGESRDLQSMRCVMDSLPWLHKPLRRVHHLHRCSASLCQVGSGSGLGSVAPRPPWEGSEAHSPAEDEERMMSMLVPALCAGA